MAGAPPRPSQDTVLGDAATDPTVTFHKPSTDTDQNQRALNSDAVGGDSGGPSPPPAQVGRYEIRDTLGCGGFGYVFLAHDPVLQRLVALKVPRDSKAWTGSAGKGLLQEARLAAKVKHDRIVTIFDVGECEEFGVFIAMEYVAGQSLADRLKEGPLPSEDAIRIAAEIADAIHHAHKRGLVHRDLKPANILLDEAGQIKVADFGLAIHEDSQRQSRNEFSGTLAYMSPEQFNGQSHLLDGRSDIWSFGIILYECLVGRKPFRGADWSEFREELLNRPPRPLRQINDAIDQRLDDICQRCLAKDPADRFPTALDIQHALHAITRPRPKQMSRSSLVVLIATVLIFVLFAFFSDQTTGPELREVNHQRTSDQLITQGRMTDSAASETFHDLLADEPEPFVFNADNEFEMCSYLSDQRRFSTQTDAWALFKFKTLESINVDLNLTAKLRDRRGDLGLFWGLHRDPSSLANETHQCLAAVLSLSPERKLVRLSLLQLTIEGSNRDSRQIPVTATLASTVRPLSQLDKRPPTEDLHVIKIALRGGLPVSLTAYGCEVDLSNVVDKADWSAFTDGAVGLLAGSGHVVVSRASMETLVEN